HGGIDLPRVRRDQRDVRALHRRARERGEQKSVRVPRADEQDALHRALASSFAASRRRSSFLCTLPVVVIGSASMNSISRGYSYGARRSRTCAWICSISALDAASPGCSTMYALTIAPRVSSGLPITAAFATARCLRRQFSISAGPMR